MHAISPAQAIIAGILFLAGVITLLWGTELRGAAEGGLEHGAAQAAAERRRLRAVKQAVHDRNSGGRGLSGLIGRAKQTVAGMRGPRHPAAAGTVPADSGPFRRVTTAARTGMRRGAGRNGATGNRNRRPDGTRQPRRERHMGVCDRGGEFVARTSLTKVPDTEEMWCRPCVNKYAPRIEPRPQPAGPPPTPVPATSSPVPLPAGSGSTDPAAPEWAVSDVTSSGPAAGIAAAEDLVLVMAGAPATAIAASTGGTAMAAGIGSGRPGSALVKECGKEQGIIEGRVAGRPGGGVAVRGDTTDHAEWVKNAKIIIRHVAAMFAFVKTMTEDMGKGECPADLIDDTAAWTETIYAYGTQILTELAQIDKGLQPWIRTVTAHGGPQNVASPRWLEGRGTSPRAVTRN